MVLICIYEPSINREMTSINITIIGMLWTLGSDILTFSEIVGNITQGLRVALSPKDIKDKPSAKALKVTKDV